MPRLRRILTAFLTAALVTTAPPAAAMTVTPAVHNGLLLTGRPAAPGVRRHHCPG